MGLPSTEVVLNLIKPRLPKFEPIADCNPMEVYRCTQETFSLYYVRLYSSEVAWVFLIRIEISCKRSPTNMTCYELPFLILTIDISFILC